MRSTLILAAALACATLSGCAYGAHLDPSTGPPLSLEQKAAIGAEQVYQGSRLAANVALDTGVSIEKAMRLRTADTKGYGVLVGARVAYDVLFPPFDQLRDARVENDEAHDRLQARLAAYLNPH